MKHVSIVLSIALLLCLLSGCAGPAPVVELRPSEFPSPTPSAAPLPSAQASPAPATVLPSPTAAMEEASTSPTADPPTATPAPSAQEPEPSASPAAPEQPPTLARVMEGLGRDLTQLSYGQLVLVLADGSSCRVYAYDKGEDGIWTKALGFSGYVGENGVSSGKREGDKRTPAGIFRLGFAFGNEDTPNPDYPFRAVTSESYWVDDPDSRYYNQWVEGDADRDWTSAEKLSNSPTAYALALVVEYNYGQETEPGKGSAIFLHVGDEPTSGCIALQKADLTALVQWLKEDESPRIVLVADG